MKRKEGKGKGAENGGTGFLNILYVLYIWWCEVENLHPFSDIVER